MMIPLTEALTIAGSLTIAGGAIGAILATFTTRQELNHLWDAHNELWERINGTHTDDKEVTR